MHRISRSAFVLFATATLAFAGVSHDYSRVLNGEAHLSQVQLDAMYSQYRAEYPLSLSSAATSLKANFEEKVREIIAHNSNPANGWKKGLNEYSDMTEQEFAEYFNLRAE